ncbi:MAG: hypothetical protein WD009_02260 [Phycisphaeraceae bacterium]
MSERLEQLRKLYQADAADPFVTYGIALEHAKAGEQEEALRWLDETLTVDADYCYAYFQKGRLLGELGREAEARQVLAQGVERAQAAGDAHAAGELGALLASIEEA